MEEYQAKRAKNEKIILLVAGFGLFLLGGVGLLLSGHDLILMGGLMMIGCVMLAFGYIKNEEQKFFEHLEKEEDEETGEAKRE